MWSTIDLFENRKRPCMCQFDDIDTPELANAYGRYRTLPEPGKPWTLEILEGEDEHSFRDYFEFAYINMKWKNKPQHFVVKFFDVTGSVINYDCPLLILADISAIDLYWCNVDAHMRFTATFDVPAVK